MTLYTLFAETAVTANANAQALAREQFWGTMIGLLIFLGIALGLITWFLHDQQNAITTLFAKSIDANAKLSDAIDKLGDETAAANEKLQLYLDKNLDKIADAINAIDRDLKDHQYRIESLERGPNIHVAEPISDEYVRPN